MRFDYTYSKPGEPDYDKSTRYMRFKEEKKDVRVVLRWEGSISDTVYVSRDMENFIQHGLGTFTIIEKPEETQGQSPLFRGKFQLSIDKLTYEWEASSDGKNFYPTAYFVFTRKVAGTNSARTNPVTP